LLDEIEDGDRGYPLRVIDRAITSAAATRERDAADSHGLQPRVGRNVPHATAVPKPSRESVQLHNAWLKGERATTDNESMQHIAQILEQATQMKLDLPSPESMYQHNHYMQKQWSGVAEAIPPGEKEGETYAGQLLPRRRESSTLHKNFLEELVQQLQDTVDRLEPHLEGRVAPETQYTWSPEWGGTVGTERDDRSTEVPRFGSIWQGTEVHGDGAADGWVINAVPATPPPLADNYHL